MLSNIPLLGSLEAVHRVDSAVFRKNPELSYLPSVLVIS